MLNSSVMLGNYLQQTTTADDIFRYLFLLLISILKLFMVLVFCVMPLCTYELYSDLDECVGEGVYCFLHIAITVKHYHCSMPQPYTCAVAVGNRQNQTQMAST